MERLPSITDILPAAIEGLTTHHPTDRLPTRMAVEHGHRLIVWLIDGFGYDQVQRALERGLMPRLTKWLNSQRADLRPLHTVQPTMTPVALSSLLTGTWPEEHGLVGQVLRRPGRGDIEAIDVLGGPLPDGFELAVPDAAQLALAHGLNYAVIIEHRLRSGPLTRILHGHVPQGVRTFITPSGMTVNLAQALLDPKFRGLVYVYWSGLDSINHVRGADSPEWEAEVRHLDAWLGEIQEVVPSGTWLWITADHGHIPMQGALSYSRLREALPWLPSVPAQLGHTLGFDGSAQEVQKLDGVLAEVFPDHHVTVQNTYAQLQAGRFGPNANPQFMQRVGQHLIEPPPGWYWEIEPGDRRYSWSHGGTTTGELLIPFVEVCL